MRANTPLSDATIGIIMLDTTFPRIVGDVGNPASFPFPVRYVVVQGASPQRLVIEADRSLLQPFIKAGQRLVDEGVRGIATSCGFLALFHRELQAALSVPVFSSSLLQVHMANTLLQQGQKTGIITARKESLSVQHLEAIAIDQYPLAIVGMDQAEEFTSVFIHGKTTLDKQQCRLEMEQAARTLLQENPNVGAIVLECTNMGPYSKAIRNLTGLPVYDVVTMINSAHSVLI